MSHTVRLAPFDIEFACGEDETILAAALRQGIGLRYGCKHGACGSCKAKVTQGEVDFEAASGFALMDFERDAGMVLLCSAYPLEDLVIDLGDFDETELSAARPIREHRCRVSKREKISADIWRLVLEVREPAAFDFEPGQFAELNIQGTDDWRAYSMANLPSAADGVEFLVKQISGGRFSSFIAGQLAPDDEVTLRGPYGRFCLNQGHVPIVMVAGGAGMAPILAMLRSLAAARSERKVTFYYGVRGAADVICAREIAAIAAVLPAFTYIPALSEPGAEDDWNGETGLVTDVIDRLSGNLRNAEAYLCGPPAMIDTAITVLQSHGMFASRIRFDKFVSTAAK